MEELGIIGDDYRPESAKYASYELHASAYAEILVYRDDCTGHVECCAVNGEFVIEPGATLRLFTSETLRLPTNMCATVMALGQHFSVGLSGGSTYVDPGSVGAIYISFTNVSVRAIRVPVGAPVARAQFVFLSEPVEHAHEGRDARRELSLHVTALPTSVPAGEHDSRVNLSLMAHVEALELNVLALTAQLESQRRAAEDLAKSRRIRRRRFAAGALGVAALCGATLVLALGLVSGVWPVVAVALGMLVLLCLGIQLVFGWRYAWQVFVVVGAVIGVVAGLQQIVDGAKRDQSRTGTTNAP